MARHGHNDRNRHESATLPRVALIALSQVSPPMLKRIDVEGHGALLLVATASGLYVLDDTCSHGAVSLAEGELHGDEIFCPHHRGGFDVRSGVAVRAPCWRAQRSHAVSVVEGMVCVELDAVIP